jgi:2-amino-4-hydroxy-6-hydroxymethyldihydropteridine diphosphokinase
VTDRFVTAFIGLGSNLHSHHGDRQRHLEMALGAMSRIGRVIKTSSIYETDAWGVDGDQPDYLNQVAMIETGLGPSALVEAMLGIEAEIGRVRTERYGSRTIDLDVLFLGNLVINEPGVQIPHPRLHERAFVLVPLADVAPDFVHPVLGTTLDKLLRGIGNSGVRRLYSGD